MISPGIKSLGDFAIAAAGTFVGDWVSGLDGLLAAAAQLRFTGGSGGTSVKAHLQTSLDQGTTAVDIACVAFGATAAVAALNFSALTPKLTQLIPTDGTLADDTAIDGILGDRFRIKYVVTGVYSGSPVLSGRLCVR